MGRLFRMLERFDFMQQSPLTELELPTSAVFPTVLAMQSDTIAGKMADFGLKAKQAWEETKTYVSKSEKTHNTLRKPEKQEAAKSEKETSTYILVYLNPETKKAEMVEGKVTINYEDETQQIIEEALGMRSAYGMYSLVATPMIREQIDERLMEEILEKIKYENPDPFGGGTAVKVNYEALSPKLIKEYGDKIIAFEVAEKRRQMLEERIEEQMVVVEAVVRKLDAPHLHTKEVLHQLSPLMMERMLALFREKKRLSKKEVRKLLLKDLQFLSAAKTKLGAMRVQDILKVVLKIKK